MNATTPWTIRLDGEAVVFPCAPDETVLHAGLRAGIGLPYDCGSGGCGTCRVTCVEGRLDSLWPDAPGLSDRDRKRGRVLACQSRPLSDATIGVSLDPQCRPRVPPAQHRTRLIVTRAVAHDMVEFVLRSDVPAMFVPGQYAQLSVGDTGPRAYSMSNQPNPDGDWRFVIKRKPGGLLTTRLFEAAAIGARLAVDLRGPYGVACLPERTSAHIVCIAGGSGLSPMVSIGAAALAIPSTRRIDLFYGGRTSRDLFAADCFERLSGHDDRLSVTAALSEPDAGWSGPAGFIHHVVRQHLGGSLLAADIFVAGPPAMVDATVTMLAEAGVARERVRYDSFL